MRKKGQYRVGIAAVEVAVVAAVGYGGILLLGQDANANAHVDVNADKGKYMHEYTGGAGALHFRRIKKQKSESRRKECQNESRKKRKSEMRDVMRLEQILTAGFPDLEPPSCPPCIC